jgi:hypothetical protein
MNRLPEPNKADAPNAAMTLQFHSQTSWRGVGDLRRYASSPLMRFMAT